VSAPDPKEWTVTDGEVDAIHDSAYEDWNGQNIDRALIAKTCETVARRRALAELKAILGETTCFYDNGEWFAVDELEIMDRIAAIEAEES